MGQMVKNLPLEQETMVWSLGREDPLEEEMATHSRILAWRISWTEESGGLQSMESQRFVHDCVTNTHTQQNGRQPWHCAEAKSQPLTEIHSQVPVLCF